EAALYRIAQEALHNALRHSGAAEVNMSVCAAARKVTLEVSDRGKGFVPELATGGRGLPSLRERAAGAGGTLTVRSAPGRGPAVGLGRAVGPPREGAPGGRQLLPTGGRPRRSRRAERRIAPRCGFPAARLCCSRGKPRTPRLPKASDLLAGAPPARRPARE